MFSISNHLNSNHRNVYVYNLLSYDIMGRKIASKKQPNPKPDSDPDSTVVQILPYLYLGPRSAASSGSFIRSREITHILSIGASPPGDKLPSVSYTKVPMLDGPGGSVENVLERARAVLDDVRLSNTSWVGEADRSSMVSSPSPVKGKEKLGQKTQKRILIHCSAAISRSPTLIAAYLISAHDLTLRQSLGMIIRARPAVNPNPELFRQLKELEVRFRGSGSMEGVENLPLRREDRIRLLEEGTDGEEKREKVSSILLSPTEWYRILIRSFQAGADDIQGFRCPAQHQRSCLSIPDDVQESRL